MFVQNFCTPFSPSLFTRHIGSHRVRLLPLRSRHVVHRLSFVARVSRSHSPFTVLSSSPPFSFPSPFAFVPSLELLSSVHVCASLLHSLSCSGNITILLLFVGFTVFARFDVSRFFYFCWVSYFYKDFRANRLSNLTIYVWCTAIFISNILKIHIEINNLYKLETIPQRNDLVFFYSKYLKVMVVEMHAMLFHMFRRVAMVLLFWMNL